MHVHLQNLQINVIYQGHWVKVKVTAAKKCLYILLAGRLPSVERLLFMQKDLET